MKHFRIARFVTAIVPALMLLATVARAEMTLVMVEEPGCVWCAKWNAEVGPIYPKTAEGEAAPLTRIDIREPTPENMVFDRKLVFTPTFVLLVDGEETGRIEGYPGEAFFWGLLGKLIDTAATMETAG
ncbi:MULTISPECIES: hypothetical protein [unclassified Marinovum]